MLRKSLLPRDFSFAQQFYTHRDFNILFASSITIVSNDASIDACGSFRVVFHTLTNNRQRYILALGNARSSMSGNIHGKRYGQTEFFTDDFQRTLMLCAA